MKKILVLGASILQVPAIKKAKELGYFVAVVDYDERAVGIQYADKYFNVSTIDEEALIEVAKKFNPDGVLTVASDMPMRAVSKISEVLGLSSISYQTALNCTDKSLMIKCFSKYNVPHPWFIHIKNEKEFLKNKKSIQFPCILKPTDNSGSRGVCYVESASSLEGAYSYAKKYSRNGEVLIEEYLDGPEVSVEVFVLNEVPYVIQVTDKITTGLPHFVELGHSQPSQLDSNIIKKIKEIAVNSVKSVGITQGPAHVEMKVTKSGPKMIELGARLGGDNITTHLVPLSTGVDMLKATIESSCGIEPKIDAKFHRGAAIRYFQTSIGRISSINNISDAEKIKGVTEITFTKHVGDMVNDISESADRIGFVISQSDTASSAINICKKVMETVDIEIK